MDDDESDELYEMSGTLAEWNGKTGTILTDCGERVPLLRMMLHLRGFKAPVKVGDRIHFHASEHVTVDYSLSRIRLIEPRHPDADELAQLQTRLHPPPEEVELVGRKMQGVVESFDADKGYGRVRTSDGEHAFLHICCLRAGGYQTVAIGARVEIDALHRPATGWWAWRLLSLEQNAGS